MKKLTLIVAFTAFVIAANAQSLNVQSAAEYLRKGYLNKAKAQIDPACTDERTKGDAKTWYYKSLIYYEMGHDVQTNPKSKWKNILPTDWAEQSYAAALECKRLDTDGEYADKNNVVFKALAEQYYNSAFEAFKNKEYQNAIDLCEQVIQINNNNTGDKSLSNDASNIAGYAAYNMHNFELVKKYFNMMIRKKSKEIRVYELLFDIYQGENDTVNAMKIANSCVKNCKDNFKSDFLMARAYIMSGNIEESGKMIEKALVLAKENPKDYVNLLNLAGSIYENAKNFDVAEAKYQESLALDANQYAANFGLGSMIYNRGVDKFTAANNVPLDDETGLNEKLIEEGKAFFQQAIPYLQRSISTLDAMMTDANAIAQNRPNLYNCLLALRQCYARLDMFDEVKPIEARITEIKNAM